MTELVQVRLESGSSQRVCWVDTTKRFRVGDAITLKRSEDDVRRWTVLSISAPRDAGNIQTDWRVGGLTRVTR